MYNINNLDCNSDRYGYKFKSEGSFYCQYRITPWALIGIVLVEFIVLSIIHTQIFLMPLAYMFDPIWLATNIKPLFIYLIVIFVGVACGIFVVYGRKCRYYADDRYMCIYCGKNTFRYFYGDINHVTYKPLKLFGKDRGFICTVTTRNSCDVFRYIRPSGFMFNDFSNTPFHILCSKQPKSGAQDKQTDNNEN